MRRVSEAADGGANTSARSPRGVAFNPEPPSPRGTSGGDGPQSGRLRRGSDAGREAAREAAGREPDGATASKDFDSKLSSIQEVLSRYQAERNAQARGQPLPTNGSHHNHHNHHAGGHGHGHGHGHGAGGHGSHGASGGGGDHDHKGGGGGGGGRRWHTQSRKLDASTVLDEEVFVRHVLATPHRVRAITPGATRALSARIEYYRCHREKAQEKADRAREEQLAAQRKATGGAAGALYGNQINFIEANRRSIVPYGLPYNLQVTLESLRDQGLSTLALSTSRSRTGSSSSIGHDTNRNNQPVRPWSAMPAGGTASVRSSNGGVSHSGGAAGGRAGPSPMGRSGTWTGGYSPGGTSGPAPAAAGVHAAWLNAGTGSGDYSTGTAAGAGAAAATMVRNSSSAFASAAAAAAAAAAVASGSLPAAAEPTSSWPEGGGGVAGDDGDGEGADAGSGGGSRDRSPSFFLTTVEISSSNHDALQSVSQPGTSSGEAASFGGGIGEPLMPHPPSLSPSGRPPAVRPSTATAASRPHPSLSIVLPSRPATASGGGSGAGSSGGGGYTMRSPQTSLYGSYMRGGSATTVDGGVDPRRLRLALSSRPASGGSPTRRLEYVAEQTARRVDRALYAAEVRERAVALDLERRRTIAQAAELRAAQRREEEARLAQARAEAEKQERQRQWTGIVGLCSKLSFLAERVVEDRRVRALRQMRKESAVKIAEWYKAILNKRRQRELKSLIERVRELIRPYLAAQRIVVRHRAALRIVSFMQYTRTSNMAVVGVRKLKAGVEILQTAWRNALLVRNLQRSALYNQLTRLEREIVTLNKRNERNMQTQMMRLGKSVNILEPDASFAPYSFGSFRSHRTTSTVFRLSTANGFVGFGGGGSVTPDGGLWGTEAGGAASSLEGALSFVVDGKPPPGAEGGQPGGGGDGGRGNSPTGRGKRGGGRQYDRSKQPGRGVLHDPGDSEDDEVLRQHMEMVPREVREQVVNVFLREARRDHRKLLEQYSADKQLYQARKPIEEMRQKMLRDVGLKVDPEIKPPVLPHMRIIYPRSKLRELLRRCVEINQARLAAAEERRLQEAAAGAAAGGGGGGGAGGGGGGGHSWLYAAERTGGILWADQAGGGGGGGGGGGADRRASMAGGAPSRRALVARSASRASLKGVSYKTIKMPPQPPAS